MPEMNLLETDRLALRRLSTDDAAFILRLLNEPSFIRYIGDKGVRTLEDARAYIRSQADSYERYGFGLYLTCLKDDGPPIGICGLVKRDALEDVDIGFAFVPEHWAQGYATESAAAVMQYGHEVLGLRRIVGVTAPDNRGSINVLQKLGLRFEKMVRLPGTGRESKLFTPFIPHITPKAKR